MLITLEGIEGCGKSTQAKRLALYLEEAGVPHVLTLEPGGTRIGQQIRRILLDAGHDDLSPLAELFLYEADRSQHVAEIIQPALAAGRWVVCDRFFDATTVYQGYARDQDLDFIDMLNRTASQGIRPDFTFLLDCPVTVGLERAVRREDLSDQGQDRFERERRSFHEAVRQGYLRLAEKEPDRFAVLDGAHSPDEVALEIRRQTAPLLPGDPRGGEPSRVIR